MDGTALDFHSLRHACGAWFARNGEHPKAIQAVMRHSSITLTMDTYGHLFPDQQSLAIQKLGDLMTKAAAADCQHVCQQSGHDSVQSNTMDCESDSKERQAAIDQKSHKIGTLCENTHTAALESESTPGRIRTCDRRIRNLSQYAGFYWKNRHFPSHWPPHWPTVFKRSKNALGRRPYFGYRL
jgi:Phage integrase family